MEHIILEILNNNFENFKTLTSYQKEIVIKEIDHHPLKEKIIANLLCTDYWEDIRLEVFNMIYKDEAFRFQTMVILTNGIIELSELTEEQLYYLISNDWSLLFILTKPSLIYKNYFIIEKIINDPLILKKAFKILEKCQIYIRLIFIYESITSNKELEDKDVIKLLSSEKLSLPQWFLEEEKIKPLIIRNFSIFFDLESKHKMYLIDIFRDDISKELIDRYKPFINLYELYKNESVDIFITKIINAKEEAKILPYLNSNLTYLNSGTTTDVYTDGNMVLKLTLEKYCLNTVRDFFLLAPTKVIQINCGDTSSKQVIEIQSYLSREKNGKKISKRDIARFLTELEKYGYYTDDPNNLDLLPDNFGYLRDYHDANITGFSSPEDLPEWFKKSPIVLYDIDKIYKKELIELNN